MTKVGLFTTPSCSWRKREKKYFNENRAPKEMNIEKDQWAARGVAKMTGQMGVPVVEIGSKWIFGSDRPAIERELGRKSS